MATMRTLPKAVEYIKEKDPDSSISLSTLRFWVKSGAIPCVKAGRYQLVSMEVLEDFLGGSIGA